MYALTSHYSLDFLQPGLTVEVNRLYCCLLPMIVYIIARLYIFMTSRLVSKALSFIPNGNRAETLLNWLLGLAFIILPYFILPQVKTIILEQYEKHLGEVGKLIIDLSQPEVLKTWELAKRLFGLFVGWFALFFVVELVLRLILLVVKGVLSLFLSKRKDDN
eukprot:gene9691-10715_t